ncbi:MAG: hypothetical protein SFY32_05510 [Bacteroidota bacterium]|nr:hypothetical protein [Bacteroidota bacterium]
MSSQIPENIREKIMKGLDLAFERMIKEKSLRGEEIVVSENGKIIKVKASKFLKS